MDRCLIVTRDPEFRREAITALEGAAVHVIAVNGVHEAEAELVDERVSAVVIAFAELDGRGDSELRSLLTWTSPRPVIVVAEQTSLAAALELLSTGVADVVTRPLHGMLLRHRVKAAGLRARGPASRPIPRRKSDVLLGNAPVMIKCRDRIGMLARTDLPVAIYGPSGTGKELAARMIHCESQRKHGPLVVANCAALPESLFENELFGHQRGSYTGATAESPGLVEEAADGTLVLDEIGELSSPLQAKLLRLLQFGTYRRVGDTRTREADVRVICSTNRDLLEAVAGGTFRQDLYYRINVLHVTMPRLGEHLEDVPLLVDHTLRNYCDRHKRPRPRVSDDAMITLREHVWPGNVRELEAVVLSALALSRDGVIRPADVEIRTTAPVREAEPAALAGGQVEMPSAGLGEARQRLVDSFERTYLEQLLERVRGNVSAAAREANTDRKSLWRLLRKHGIQAAEFKPGR